MKRILIAQGALLLALVIAPSALAGDPYWPVGPPRPQAPDACGPGFYCRGICGMAYGPNYNVRPCWEPFNGLLPVPSAVVQGFPQAVPGYGLPISHPRHPLYPQYAAQMAAMGRPIEPPPSPLFPTHPFARSPRDYFMLEEGDTAYYGAVPAGAGVATGAFVPPAAGVPLGERGTPFPR